MVKGNNPFWNFFSKIIYLEGKIEMRVKAEKYQQFVHQNNLFVFFSKSNHLFLNFVIQNAWSYQLQCKPLNVIILGLFLQ